MTRVSESLAGRLSLVELSPFTYNELRTRASRERLWWCGGYPDGGVLAARRFPQWQLDYLTLLAQRDLPAWGLLATPQKTERFLRMLAAQHGQVWNASRFGQSLGVSYHTVNGYLDFLEGAFLIRRLAPYLANINKRLVKSPKVFWRDSGLLHAILNVTSADQLLHQPWIGASWEGFVIEQILSVLRQCDYTFRPYYFRTSDQHEIDLLLDLGGDLWAIEVKLSTSPGLEDMKRLDRTADLVGANQRFLVSQVEKTNRGEARVSCNLPWLLKRIQERR